MVQEERERERAGEEGSKRARATIAGAACGGEVVYEQERIKEGGD